ncbi:DUF6603 domain-containing protein [Pacificoceanicola onchidii]|uniref:DUF6603 domain-containing protein n=1 Tax=Pacificoceanicola onchidii TaxID=2562685 RepID=UPI0010A615A9|nr:DUF6603 domain-containing protein [Pacificoceanicola onchidii]
MALEEFLHALRAQADEHGALTLDADLMGKDEAARISTQFALKDGAPLSITGVTPDHIPDPDGNGLIHVQGGQAALMGLDPMDVTAIFSMPEEAPQVTLLCPMAKDWGFKDSFKGLTFFPFTELAPSHAQFIYASAAKDAQPWPGDPGHSVPLVPGVNLLTDTTISKLDLVSKLIGEDVSPQFRLYGPFGAADKQALPVGTLRAPLTDKGLTLGTTPFKLELGPPAVGVRIDASTAKNPGQDVSFVVFAEFQKTLEVSVAIPQAGNRVTFSTHPLPHHDGIDSLIAALPGCENFRDVVPGEVTSAFAKIGLRSFSAVYDVDASKLTYLRLAIGATEPWPIIDNVLTLTDMGLVYDIVNPGAKSVQSANITASAAFLPDVFKGDFEFALGVSKTAGKKWQLETISGAFYGHVSLGDLIQKLVGSGVSVPKELNDITFSDFGVAVENTGTEEKAVYQYTIFGSCGFSFPMLGTELTSLISVVVTKEGTSHTIALSGVIVIGEANFFFELDIAKDKDTSDVQLKAGWTMEDLLPGPDGEAAEPHPLGFGDIAKAFGFEPPAIPKELDLGLKQAGIAYDFTNKTLMLEAQSVNYGSAAFVADRSSGTSTYVFAFELGKDLSLGDLPLVGPALGDIGGVKNLRVLFTSQPVSAKKLKGYNGLLPKGFPPISAPGSGATGEEAKKTEGDKPALPKGFNVSADIYLGGLPLPIGAGGDSAPVSEAPPPAKPKPPTPPSGNATWININKSIGPVGIERIGVRYEDGRAWLLIDGSFTLAMLEMSLMGLSLGFKLDDPSDISVHLDGMSLEFQSGPLTIAGGFLHMGDDYLGMAMVKAAGFGLTAIGGLAPKDKSFFIFARLNAPLGGPPYFFITGLAGGFGINRSLILPKIDDLPNFALMPQNNQFPTKLDPKDPGGSLASVLAQTAEYIHPEPGANWIAAGIDVTSFEMVDASVVVTVAFGVDFEVALLGICRVTVPKGAPDPVLYMEIALEARFSPAQHLIAIDGRLTPASYLFEGIVRISGGFAFYIWYGGDHAGEFVVSVGGYHPQFKKPDYYPVVPRLTIIYQVGPLMIKGQTYFALLPHMLMAGLEIDAVWKSGPIKAWFSAGVDFLLGWRPFHYEASAFIHIGASFTLDLLFTSVDITIHVGVDLDIWGPKFGGKATVDLDIISFTIHFGADKTIDHVDWLQFRQSFLPGGEATGGKAAGATPVGAPTASGDAVLCTAAVPDGMLKDLKASDGDAPSEAFFDWLVDPNHFVIASTTVIPSKSLQFNDFTATSPLKDASSFTPVKGAPADLPKPSVRYDATKNPNGVAWNSDFGVLPMGLASDGFETGLTLSLMKLQEGADYTDPTQYVDAVDDVAIGATVTSAQAAMWAGVDPGMNGARLVKDALTTVEISPMIQHPQITLKADLWAMMFNMANSITWQFDAPQIAKSDNFNPVLSDGGTTLTFNVDGAPAPANHNFILSALNDAKAAQARGEMADALGDLGLDLGAKDINTDHMAAYPLWDWPMIRLLGEEIAA